MSSFSFSSSRSSSALCAPSSARISSSSLICIAAVSRFCVFWIRKTIRKVTIVVDVLITSCQVSLKWNIGPLTAHTMTSATAITNVAGFPVIEERLVENFENQSLFVTGGSCRVKVIPDDTHSPALAPKKLQGTSDGFSALARSRNEPDDFQTGNRIKGERNEHAETHAPAGGGHARDERFGGIRAGDRRADGAATAARGGRAAAARRLRVGPRPLALGPWPLCVGAGTLAGRAGGLSLGAGALGRARSELALGAGPLGALIGRQWCVEQGEEYEKAAIAGVAYRDPGRLCGRAGAALYVAAGRRRVLIGPLSGCGRPAYAPRKAHMIGFAASIRSMRNHP
ncbi:exported hypothetical protein [Paraburkholderia piptadeniae]|uniref:Uncharacterized protein n=1 Tax=Paraburkholderia piptadeniae TaxID=1701573 RepID=A0A1N7SDC3_9BURK|nr:exported hypothetical protein [Paraburkholderia piptadeniae]